MTAIAEMVDRYSDQMLKRRELDEQRDDAIDAKVAELVDEAMCSPEALSAELVRYLINTEDRTVRLGGGLVSMTDAWLRLAFLAADGAHPEMSAIGRAIKGELADALRDDYGMQARAEEILACEAAEVERERRGW